MHLGAARPLSCGRLWWGSRWGLLERLPGRGRSAGMTAASTSPLPPAHSVMAGSRRAADGAPKPAADATGAGFCLAAKASALALLALLASGDRAAEGRYQLGRQRPPRLAVAGRLRTRDLFCGPWRASLGGSDAQGGRSAHFSRPRFQVQGMAAQAGGGPRPTLWAHFGKAWPSPCPSRNGVRGSRGCRGTE